MGDQVVIERKKRLLTADRKKTEEGKKMGNRKKTGRKKRRIFPTCLFRQPDYNFRTPLTPFAYQQCPVGLPDGEVMSRNGAPGKKALVAFLVDEL